MLAAYHLAIMLRTEAVDQPLSEMDTLRPLMMHKVKGRRGRDIVEQRNSRKR